MNRQNFLNTFEQIKDDKQFMNEIIDDLSETTTEVSPEIFAYSVLNYEPDYKRFLDNIFSEAKFHRRIRYNFEDKDILGHLNNEKDY